MQSDARNGGGTSKVRKRPILKSLGEGTQVHHQEKKIAILLVKNIKKHVRKRKEETKKKKKLGSPTQGPA